MYLVSNTYINLRDSQYYVIEGKFKSPTGEIMKDDIGVVWTANVTRKTAFTYMLSNNNAIVVDTDDLRVAVQEMIDTVPVDRYFQHHKFIGFDLYVHSG